MEICALIRRKNREFETAYLEPVNVKSKELLKILEIIDK
jgi:hypothetical protein